MRPTSKFVLLACSIFLASGILLAEAQSNQAPKPAASASAEMLREWNGIADKVIGMAQDFPEDKYDFKVQKDQRTFAQNILHIAGVDFEAISAVAGKKMGPELKDQENPSRDEYKTKAQVVALIKQAASDGASVIKSQGDAGLNAVVKYPWANMMVHASDLWTGIIEHSGEHYGQLVVYYRANNLIPPESRPQPK